MVRISGATLLFLVIPAVGLVSCARVSTERAFSQVGNEVRERGGYRVHWDQGSRPDGEATQAIRSLLAEPLTADAAAQIALLNNRRLQARYEGLGVAQAAVVDAGLLSNPIFHSSATFRRKPDDGVDATPDLTYEIEANFLDLLYSPMRKAVAKSEFEAAKLRVAAAVVRHAAQTRMAFYRAQADVQTVTMLRHVTAATGAAYDFANRLFAAGNIPSVDLFRQEAFHQQANINLATAEATLSESRERLNRLMGTWGPDTEWSVHPGPSDVPADMPSLDDLEMRAVARSLDLEIARKKIDALAKTLGATKTGALLPRLLVGAEVEREDDEWKAGPSLTLPIPLLNRGQARTASARARLRRQRQEYYALAVDVRSSARQAGSRLRTAHRIAEFYRDDVLPLREQIVRETQRQYNAMQIGVVQLLRAKEQEIDAGRQSIEALYNFRAARTDLDQILNGLLVDGNSSSEINLRSESATPTTDPEGGH